MNCLALPDTGGPAVGWIVAGLGCLLVGWMLVRRSLPGRSRGLGAAALIIVAAGCLAAQPSPSQAAGSCESGASPASVPHAVVIEQTSVIAGLAPSAAPVAIAGRVVNRSRDSTYVTAVTVRITSVTKAGGAPAGSCSAADYVLVDATMPVERPLPAVSSVDFSGASIGFENTSRNQDACKRATVHLGYVSGSR